MADEIRASIQEFIALELLFYDEAEELATDRSLSTDDLVDSTGWLEIADFLREEFEIQVADADMVPANFDTVELLAAYVRRTSRA